MTITLTLENVNEATLQVIESLRGFNKDLIITRDNEECPICKAHNCTPNKKTTKVIK